VTALLQLCLLTKPQRIVQWSNMYLRSPKQCFKRFLLACDRKFCIYIRITSSIFFQVSNSLLNQRQQELAAAAVIATVILFIRTISFNYRSKSNDFIRRASCSASCAVRKFCSVVSTIKFFSETFALEKLHHEMENNF
jgi:hypothetical protein